MWESIDNKSLNENWFFLSHLEWHQTSTRCRCEFGSTGWWPPLWLLFVSNYSQLSLPALWRLSVPYKVTSLGGLLIQLPRGAALGPGPPRFFLLRERTSGLEALRSARDWGTLPHVDSVHSLPDHHDCCLPQIARPSPRVLEQLCHYLGARLSRYYNI